MRCQREPVVTETRARGPAGGPRTRADKPLGRPTPQSCRARAGVYQLLANVYLREIDPDVLAVLRAYPAFAAAAHDDGHPPLCERLRAEYARLFLLNVYPYESAYVDEAAMLNTAATHAVAVAYRAAGFTPDPQQRAGALDHIGLELDLLGHLAEREGAARAHGDVDAATGLRTRQRAFLAAHLAAWGPVFADAVTRDARLPLYREIGAFTAEFLLADLHGLMADGSPSAVPEPDHTTDALPADWGAGSDLRTLARGLTTTARAGLHLSRESLFRLAGQLELPLAPTERWLMLEQLFQGAARYDQLGPLLAELLAMVGQAASTYARWERRYPGAVQAIRPWRQRAQVTAAMLREMRTQAARRHSLRAARA
jgi:TorA maturation chaperone TorD